METLLVEIWLDGAESLRIQDEASIAVLRERVRLEGEHAGLSPLVIQKLGLAATELARNQLLYATDGRVLVRAIERQGVAGLEVVAADRGPGIRDPARALTRPGQSEHGLGVGLSSVIHLSDEVDFDLRWDEGSCIWARKFAASVPRRREVGTLSRPHPAERVSGDHAYFLRTPEALLLAVADGLGHGRLARAASDAAICGLRDDPRRPLDEILLEAHEALRKTRGAVMAITRLEEDQSQAFTASVGNVSTYMVGPNTSHRTIGVSSALGLQGKARRARIEQTALNQLDVVIQHSDGLSIRTSLDPSSAMLREHPIVIAQRLLEEFGTDHDDATVQVAR